MGYENKEPGEFLKWAKARNRRESPMSELMQTYEGRRIWKRQGITWIGEFFPAKGHACSRYLKMYLERKGIDIDLGE